MLVDEVGRGEPATAGSPLSVGRADVPDPQVPERASRRTYTAQYKLDVLAEYDRLDKNGKGALMRREGLYSSLLTEVPPDGGHRRRAPSWGQLRGCSRGDYKKIIHGGVPG